MPCCLHRVPADAAAALRVRRRFGGFPLGRRRALHLPRRCVRQGRRVGQAARTPQGQGERRRQRACQARLAYERALRLLQARAHGHLEGDGAADRLRLWQARRRGPRGADGQPCRADKRRRAGEHHGHLRERHRHVVRGRQAAAAGDEDAAAPSAGHRRPPLGAAAAPQRARRDTLPGESDQAALRDRDFRDGPQHACQDGHLRRPLQV
mmetsp:Transcript_8851/g.20657  ORF Transcript_8851/g.20657 Transcript_8851/m.20657 type:complete len:209 (-) Transcript_8851:1652-2278(-)